MTDAKQRQNAYDVPAVLAPEILEQALFTVNGRHTFPVTPRSPAPARKPDPETLTVPPYTGDDRKVIIPQGSRVRLPNGVRAELTDHLTVQPGSVLGWRYPPLAADGNTYRDASLFDAVIDEYNWSDFSRAAVTGPVYALIRPLSAEETPALLTMFSHHLEFSEGLLHALLKGIARGVYTGAEHPTKKSVLHSARTLQETAVRTCFGLPNAGVEGVERMVAAAENAYEIAQTLESIQGRAYIGSAFFGAGAGAEGIKERWDQLRSYLPKEHAFYKKPGKH